jgi:Flp pilus assembly protein TadG
VRRSRRGSQAVEFACSLPILMLFAAGICDLSQYLYVTEGMVAAVASGTRAGAVVGVASTSDPLLVATSTARTSWNTAGLPGTPVFTARYAGSSPDREIVLEGTTDFVAYFGLVPAIPKSLGYTGTMRAVRQ